MKTINQTPAKISAFGDWIYDRDLENADNAASEEYDRIELIEKSVTIEELLEEVTEKFTSVQNAEFMKALARGEESDRWLIYCLLFTMKNNIVNKKLSEVCS